MDKIKKKKAIKERRRGRVRSKISGTADKPRLNVFRSNKGFYLQIIDDSKGVTLVSAHSRELKSKAKQKRIEQAAELGTLLAKKALDKGIKEIVFDRSSYRYHGRVKAIADSAREQGLKF